MVATELINFYFTSVVSLRIWLIAEIGIATRRFSTEFFVRCSIFRSTKPKRKIFNEIGCAYAFDWHRRRSQLSSNVYGLFLITLLNLKIISFFLLFLAMRILQRISKSNYFFYSFLRIKKTQSDDKMEIFIQNHWIVREKFPNLIENGICSRWWDSIARGHAFRWLFAFFVGFRNDIAAFRWILDFNFATRFVYLFCVLVNFSVYWLWVEFVFLCVLFIWLEPAALTYRTLQIFYLVAIHNNRSKWCVRYSCKSNTECATVPTECESLSCTPFRNVNSLREPKAQRASVYDNDGQRQKRMRNSAAAAAVAVVRRRRRWRRLQLIDRRV